MLAKKYTEFTYLGLSKEQKKEIGDNIKAQYQVEKPAPNIPDNAPKMTPQQREVAKIKFEAGLKDNINKYKEVKPYNDDYIDKKIEGMALVVVVQGQVMKAGEPVLLRQDSDPYKKLINLIDNADKMGAQQKYVEGLTVEATSFPDAENALKLLKQIEVEKQKKKESKK